MKLYRIALRNLLRNPRRSLLSIISIAVTAIVIVILMGLLAWMKSDMKENITRYISGHVRVRHVEFDEEDEGNPLRFAIEDLDSVLTRLEDVEGVCALSPRIGLGTAIYRDGKTIPAAGIAVDFIRENEFTDLSAQLLSGAVPQNNEKGALFSKFLAEKLGVNIGDSLTLLLTTRNGGGNAVTLRVKGIFDFTGRNVYRNTFFAPLPLMQRILRMQDSATEILILANDLENSTELAEKVQSALDKNSLEILPWQRVSELWSMMKVGDISYSIMALVFFLLGSTVIINTTIMTVFERHKEIGTLGAMGMEPRKIVRLFFLEATFLGIFGAAFGVFIGALISIPISNTGIPLYDNIMSESFIEVSRRLYVRFTIPTGLYVFCFASLVASIAAYFPSRKASQIDPAEALKGEK